MAGTFCRQLVCNMLLHAASYGLHTQDATERGLEGTQPQILTLERKIQSPSRKCCCTPEILVLGGLRQEDAHK